MSNEPAFLALYFDAPMLSFGVNSNLDQRDTQSYPTRSAVTGLAAAALGMARDDREGLARLAELSMLSIAFLDAPMRLLNDYHTVGGGYSPSEVRSVPSNAAGKSRGTVLTDRFYLIDGKFAAVLAGDAEFLRKVGAALLNPVWGGWIGRKNCIPATPVNQGLFHTEAEALSKLGSLRNNAQMQIWEEVPPDTPGANIQTDIPIDFACRSYRLRGIVERS